MKNFIRAVLSFITFVAVQFFSYWMVFGQILPEGLDALAVIFALIAAGFAARFVWVRSGDNAGGLLGCIGYGAGIAGAIGFIGGFFGPMILLPDSNQGPLLGLFITGPLGFVGGGFAGAVWWWIRRHRDGNHAE